MVKEEKASDVCEFIGSSAADKGRQRGQFALCPQCKGAPNSAGLVQIRSGLIVSHIPFFKEFVSL